MRNVIFIAALGTALAGAPPAAAQEGIAAAAVTGAVAGAIVAGPLGAVIGAAAGGAFGGAVESAERQPRGRITVRPAEPGTVLRTTCVVDSTGRRTCSQRYR